MTGTNMAHTPQKQISDCQHLIELDDITVSAGFDPAIAFI